MNIVTGALGSVIPKLALLLKEEYDLQKGVRKKIRCLSRDFESMQAALRKVAEVPLEQLDEQVKLWASDVRELSYDVEDVVDTFLLRVDGREARDPNRFRRAAKKIGKLFSKSKARHQNAEMIKTINEQAKELAERRDRYKVDEIVANRAPSSTVDPRLGAIFQQVKELVGIEKPSEELISKLSLQGDESKKTKTVSVVGVGGLGKTTLVKAVYDKLKVDFDCTAFVSVGQNPDLKKVFREVLIGLNKEKYTDLKFTVWDEKLLIHELREYLEAKRYLILIDDVWKADTWKIIKWALVENNNGSRLITTSRIIGIADQPDEIYRLQPLPPEKSRKLFYTRIFGGEGRCPDNQLDELSDKILKKCDGVPLAIITMASLLLGKSRGQWIEVCNSIGFHDTKQILSLSYYDLPPHLKACLLYLSAFPEDYFIDKDSLIWKWVAEGFVQKENTTGFFEVGEGYFNELINRSLIMAVEFEGIVLGCRVHDMVLDLLQQISQEENFMTITDNDGTMTIPPSGRVRRLAHQNRAAEPTHHDRRMDPLGHLRSVIAYNCDYKVLSLSRFKVLRVLALEHCEPAEGSIHLEHLESLLHLRYLRLTGTPIQKFPEGIGALKLLQTLDLKSTKIKELPSSIGQLTQLICLHVITNTDDQHLWDTLVLPQTLQHLNLPYQKFNALPSCINPSALPNLNHLVMCVQYMDQEALKILGGMPELHYLKLIVNSLVTLTIHGCFFQRLRSLWLPLSMVRFVPNEGSSALFTVGNGHRDVAARTEMREDAPSVMPNLKMLEFAVYIKKLMDENGSCANLGLECLPSLEKVKVNFRLDEAFPDDVKKEEAALRRAIEVHPNRPTVEVYTTGEPKIRRRLAFKVRRNRPTLKSSSSVQPQPEPDERDGADDDELARHFAAGTPTFSLGAAPQGSTAARHRRSRMHRRPGASSSPVPSVSRDDASSSAPLVKRFKLSCSLTGDSDAN
ncbi:hypothetical protein EJB05_25709 [Eragrostis curvula]|uniref:AAA+ ATPase domain-containing protein n=1 Tax=Eragrostis curvula TaxID=38414 RepID=A0A5J9UJI5_9POAL|nr:hypothetical protein EJB05_25709 [Eragrostis curvula]